MSRVNTASSGFTVPEFLNFGLFLPDTKRFRVRLPNRLFQEFLAAVYLAFDVDTCKALFTEIQETRQTAANQYLGDVVNSLGFENVIKFVVGLSPWAGREVCSLYRIKQQQTSSKMFCQSVYSYEFRTTTGMY